MKITQNVNTGLQFPNYMVFHKKKNRFIFDYNSRNSWSIFIILTPVE